MTDRIRQPLRQTNCVTRAGDLWQVDRVTWTWSGRTIEHLASFQTEAEAETYAREESARSAAAAMTLGKRPRQAGLNHDD